jgi:uncharacterized iron-regulated membrane protein
MKVQKLLRLIHHWGSIIIAIPLVVIIGAGILLQVKKEVEWIQPPSQHGVSTEVPSQTMQQLFEVAKSVAEAEITSWAELERVDFKPDKGIVKFVSINRIEIQIDANSSEILSVSHRRSDLIESIHDGSWFAEGAKLYLFLPVGIILFILWMTGIYMFFLPYYKKAQKKKAKAARLRDKL